MDAGELDRRITIRRSTETANELNEPIFAWSDLMTVWAAYEPVSDGERMRAQQVGAWLSARFRIRWSRQAATIDGRDQVVFDGRTFGILGVKEIGRREGLEISASSEAERPRDEAEEPGI